jgi:1-acyl-sn-glycerol-3-phosphate acyltransferase
MSEFDDIRAYHDHEVNPVLESLLNDSEFLAFIAQHMHPKLNRIMSYLIKKSIRKQLKKKFAHIHNVAAWQNTLAPYVESLINKTTDQFIVKGIENLDRNENYLFISNHRDIALDPMLVNYALHQSGFSTSKIAIGDNLLGRQFVAKLMRLNKSFVVKRSITVRRDKLKASSNLSLYVHESLKQHSNVWIAQKEGRAKDSRDKTDTAVLKMLHLAGRKLGWEFKDSMIFLKIVPVSISYEWDPCDLDKANELTLASKMKTYEKSDDEDFQTILKGLKGEKGKVSIHFSKPLHLESNQAEDWAKEIDRCIYSGYELFDSNLLANQILNGTDSKTDKTLNQWQTRFSKLSSEAYQQVVKSYAQPVIAKTNVENN